MTVRGPRVRVFSPMATGNGAFVVHQALARDIPGYELRGYDPRWTLFPPALPLVARGRADLVHTTPDYAFFFARRGVPLVATFHNYVLDPFMAGYSSPAQRIHYRTDLRIFTRLALERAAAVTSVSRFTAGLVKQDLGFDGRVRVIHNGIDAETFRPGDRGRAGRRVTVLFSGNLTRRKGADLLPGIARLLDRGVEIVYTGGLRAGGGLPDIPGLRGIGSFPHAAMPGVYRRADMLLFPTVREGFGLAAAEAMACGLPVVATDCSSLPELVEHGRGGYLCRLGDVEEFAARINELAASPGLRREMGEFNRARVEERFTLDRMVGRYRQVFEEALSRA